MKFLCCGIEYSTTSPDTYWCIEKFLIKKGFQSPKVINNHKVQKQYYYVLTCPKNGCTKVEIIYEGLFVDKQKAKVCRKILKRVPLSGLRADEFLQSVYSISFKQPQRIPGANVVYSKFIPTSYGKILSATTQRPRYFNEAGYSGETIKCEVFTYKI